MDIKREVLKTEEGLWEIIQCLKCNNFVLEGDYNFNNAECCFCKIRSIVEIEQ